jgi:hypothetical protein
MVFEIIAAFFAITNSNPSLLISFTVSSLFIFVLPSLSIPGYMYGSFGGSGGGGSGSLSVSLMELYIN